MGPRKPGQGGVADDVSFRQDRTGDTETEGAEDVRHEDSEEVVR